MQLEATAPIESKFTAGYYGMEFDDLAKERMLYGCNLMRPILDRYARFIQGSTVEFGPFRNPLITRPYFENTDLLYVDGDETIVEELKNRYQSDPRVLAIHMDLNKAQELDVNLRGWSRVISGCPLIRSSLISQVLNYLDYRSFFISLHKASAPGALLFVNNVIDYGIPELFSELRPRTNEEMIQFLGDHGWTVIETQQFPSVFSQQKHPRLVLVAKKT